MFGYRADKSTIGHISEHHSSGWNGICPNQKTRLALIGRACYFLPFIHGLENANLFCFLDLTLVEIIVNSHHLGGRFAFFSAVFFD